MNDKGKNEIREYLLGRIAEANVLEAIEERLFSDDEFCSQVEVAEEELVHDFVFGKLSPADREAFEEKIADNSEIRFKTEMAQALKEKAREENVAPTAAPGFLASLKAFFRQPAYVGAFAVLLVGVLAFSFFLLSTRDNSDLVELRNIYQKERAIEPRISEFGYAPLAVTRGEVKNEANETKLLSIKANLLQAVVKSPTAKNHYALGIFYLTQRNFADAVEAVKELGKAVELDDNARYHNDLGSAYFELAERGKADESFENRAHANEEFTKALELDPNFLEALFNRSLTLQKLSLPQQAKESWNLYLQKDPSSKWAEEARKYLAQLEKQPTSEKKKDEILQDFLAAYRSRDEKTAWKIHSETKGLFNGITPFEQLSKEYLEAKQLGDEARSKEALKAMIYLGDLEREKNTDFFFAELASNYTKIDAAKAAQLLQARSLLTEGRALRASSQSAASIERFEKGKQALLAAGDSAESYVAELEAASTLSYTGRVSDGLSRLKSLIQTAEARKFKVLIPVSYYWVGVCEWKQNEISRSVKSKQTAISLAEETGNSYEVQHSAEDLANIYVKLGEQAKALAYINKALENKDPYYSNPYQVCRNLRTSSIMFRKFDFPSIAADFAMEGLQLSRQVANKNDLLNVSLQELTKALAQKQQFDKALEYADESNKIALDKEKKEENSKLIGDTFLFRGELKYQMQKCNEALSDYESSLEFYQKLPELAYNVYDSHKGKLLCFQMLGKRDEFAGEFKTVLQLSEKYRQNIHEDDSRQAFFDNEQEVFDAAVENALQQNDNREAFDLLETSRARSLLDFVKSKKSVVELETEFGAVAKPLSLQEIQLRMPENVQVIQYAVLKEKLAVWTLTKDRFEFSEQQISDAELAKKVSAYRKAVLEKAAPASLKPAAQELYKLLLPPNYDSAKKTCLILDKFLYQLPFTTLVSPAGRFLIEDAAVIYSPSASIFVLASENAKEKENAIAEHLLSVGNPSFDREENPKLADLPQAETEVQAIAKDYPGAQEFTGDKATRESFLDNIENAEIIHFAGHFVANERAPGYSKLLFAGGDLRSFELAEKRLPKTKLVVLSACQTGFEHYNKSEGAIGIARTFLATGAPLVLASNWQVDSEATKDLMIAFHRNRKENGWTSAESLRQAQLELLKNEATAAPYYWSAFNLVGGFAAY